MSNPTGGSQGEFDFDVAGQSGVPDDGTVSAAVLSVAAIPTPGSQGRATLVPFGSDDSGSFYFFSPANKEVLIKVIDGCGFNQHFWVFAAAASNVEYTLTVTDTQTGQTRTYDNALGQASPAVTDTNAFATCP